MLSKFSKCFVFVHYTGPKATPTAELDNKIASDVANDDGKNDLDMGFLKNTPQQTKCISKISNGQKWFDHISPLEVPENGTKGDIPTKLNKYWLEKIEQYTEKLYVKEMEIFVNLNSENNVAARVLSRSTVMNSEFIH